MAKTTYNNQHRVAIIPTSVEKNINVFDFKAQPQIILRKSERVKELKGFSQEPVNGLHFFILDVVSTASLGLKEWSHIF